jgi:hypothetical protein
LIGSVPAQISISSKTETQTRVQRFKQHEKRVIMGKGGIGKGEVGEGWERGQGKAISIGKREEIRKR